MLKLNYHLTVHAPFRPFEGHLIEMKTRSLLGFDLEQKALLGDVMLLYPPSQIAMAALKYALHKLGGFILSIVDKYR
uniref:Cyclin C-terminal domain-containing protein n=1 Tax=Parascaris equorum TaxID=6256 RepID=A0A914RRT6_PAREQ